jgi:sulfur relay (sulfurtransferase) complex TusBCD TusD component (DsrE family)
MAVDDCGITEAEMISGIEKGSMKALANWVKNSDQVMVF